VVRPSGRDRGATAAGGRDAGADGRIATHLLGPRGAGETRSEPRPSMNRPPHAEAAPPDLAPAPGPPAPPFDLVVADASWTWTERLFAPLAALGPGLLLIKACDWRTALNQRRPAGDWLWPLRRVGPRLWQRTFVLPPGWMKTFPRLGMLPLARAVR